VSDEQAIAVRPLSAVRWPLLRSRLDQERLTQQLGRIFTVMRDGEWRSLNEIADVTAAPHASISAQLRHLRKPRFGAYVVEKRRRGDSGTWEYRVGGRQEQG
jgi:hypothetical protein